MKPPRWSAEQWADNDLFLMGRAAGSCERCGKECGPVERHHRKRRREGGDSLSNLLVVGRECHAQIHAHPVESRKFGWIVSVYRDPLEVPVLWHRSEWVSFDDDGNRLPLPDLEDAHA